jgi:hypothetical protein
MEVIGVNRRHLDATFSKLEITILRDTGFLKIGSVPRTN